MKYEVETLNDLRAVLDNHDRTLVVFTQPSTCAPCRALKPHLERFVTKHEQPVVAIVDLDKVPDAMVEYGLMRVPTLRVHEHGEWSNVQAGTVVQLERELNL